MAQKTNKSENFFPRAASSLALAGRYLFPDAISEGFLSSCFGRWNALLSSAVRRRVGVGRASGSGSPGGVRRSK